MSYDESRKFVEMIAFGGNQTFNFSDDSCESDSVMTTISKAGKHGDKHCYA